MTPKLFVPQIMLLILLSDILRFPLIATEPSRGKYLSLAHLTLITSLSCPDI